MGIPILASVLRSLSNVYRFKSAGADAPVDFETSLPIQPVHDLAPMASLGSALGPIDGWWIAATVITHVAPGTINFDASMRFPAASWNGYPPAPSYDPAHQMAWVHRMWGHTTDDSDLQSIQVSILFPLTAIGPVGTSNPPTEPMLGFRSLGSIGGGILLATADLTITNPTPLLVGPAGDTVSDAFIRTRSVADNLGTLVNTMYTMIWVGPKGVFPPMT